MSPTEEGGGRTAAAYLMLFGLLGILLGVVVLAEAHGGIGEPTAAETGPTGEAPPPTEFAGRVGVNGLDIFHPDQAPHDLDRLRAAGLPRLRENFWWDDLEPAPGRFDWTAADALMSEASRHGIEVLAILDYSAEWASSAPSGAADPLFYPPRDFDAFAGFAGAVAERYGPGGSFWRARPDLEPAPVTAVEIWNEPWLDVFWRPSPDPAAYADLALRAARAVDAASGEVDVLIDGSATDRVGGVPWIRQVLTAEPDLGGLVDAFAIHPYTGLDQLALTREETAALGVERPLWITEIGWSTATDSSGDPLEHAVDEPGQAARLVEAVTESIRRWDVERVYVYTDTCDEPGPATSLEGHFGLCRADGTPKPAWDALVALVAGRPS